MSKKNIGTIVLLVMLLIGAADIGAAVAPLPVASIGASATDGVNVVSTDTSIYTSGTIGPSTSQASNVNGLLTAQQTTSATSTSKITATAAVDPTFANGAIPLVGFVADATGPASVMTTNLVAQYNPTGQTGVVQDISTVASGNHVDMTLTATGDAWNDFGANTKIIGDGTASFTSVGQANSAKTAALPTVTATTTVIGATATSETNAFSAGYVNPSQSTYVLDVAKAIASENGGSMTATVGAAITSNTATNHAGQVSQTINVPPLVPSATSAGATTTVSDIGGGVPAQVGAGKVEVTAQMGAGTMNAVQSGSYSVTVGAPVAGVFTKTTDLVATQGTIAAGPTYPGPDTTIGTVGTPTAGYTSATATSGVNVANANVNNGILLGKTIDTVEQAHLTQTATTTIWTTPYVATGTTVTAIQPVVFVTA
jgi:adhesin/invasin